MIYIYDMVMNEKRITSFTRYTSHYKLERKFVMGTKVFYSFVCPGAQKILVIPGFAEQFKEVQQKLSRYRGGKGYDCYKRWILKELGEIDEEDDYPTQENEAGIMKVVTVLYKDIKVSFEYVNGKMRLIPEFEIYQNNIFGNGKIVVMNQGKDED